MKITLETFGFTQNGQQVDRFWLQDGLYKVGVLTLGGIIQSLYVPNKNGNESDVVLGFDTVKAYEQQTCYIGALLGRHANRIVGGSVSLEGREYHLLCNDNGICHLHGGAAGFDKKIWKAAVSEKGLVLSYLSADGEEGYPGNLQVSVTYLLKNGALSITYHAESDKTTICNLSNHAYFNLAGHSYQDVGEQEIQVYADQYTPLGSSGAPEGKICSVAGTPLDLRELTAFQEHWNDAFSQIRQAHGYDHNYLIRGHGMRTFARAVCESSGICLTVMSDMPAMQLYTGNYLENLPVGKDGAIYDIRSGFCIETQYPPNSVNCPQYESAVLPAGAVYEHTTIYQFSLQSEGGK